MLRSMASRWLPVAFAAGCAAPAAEPRSAPAAPLVSASASVAALPPAPAEERVRLVPAPNQVGRERFSPGGDRELVPLTTVPGDTSVVALVRGGDVAGASLFVGAEGGMFASEDSLVLKKGKRVAFTSEDGTERASFEAGWPPVLDRGVLVLSAPAPELIVTDVRGARKVSVPGVSAAGARVVMAESGAFAVLSSMDGAGEATVHDRTGKKTLRIAYDRAVASTDGRTLAVLVMGQPTHTVHAIDVTTGQKRVSFSVPTATLESPQIAVDAPGTTVLAGGMGRLFLADVATRRVREVPGLPPEEGHELLADIKVTPHGEACLFGTDANTRRISSCEASHLVEIKTGKRRALTLLDACVETGNTAARVSFPAPAAGRRFIASSFFGPRGVCGVSVTPDGSHAARLETDAAGTALSLVVKHSATPGARDEFTLPRLETTLSDAYMDLSPQGDRVSLWMLPNLLLIDPTKRIPLVQIPGSTPGEFTHGGKILFNKFSDDPIVDRDGKAMLGWPGRESQDDAAVRCVVGGRLERCSVP